ncbi:hypothetical protein D0Z00_002408 [Geotrichum galactomycetum]|uniref:Uncharacterized protein n=1 Tax=Geotrichum galactomycetum TaxID=27317 RepID=A0ACB6V4A4_9ASCO|nr:hypothetical protein D0Z00_002408 [Geotrichum candidum]
MYIQLGLPNLSPTDQAALLPNIVKDIAKASPKNASTIFGILLKILAQWSPPERGSTAADQLRSELGFDQRPQDAAFLAQAFTNLFLLDLAPLLNQSATTDKPLSCRSPGLGFEQYEFLTRNHAGTFSGNNALHEAKRHALKLLLAGSAFTEEELYFPLLVASLDKNSAINSQAETPFKKLKVNLEDDARVRYLYRLVLGDLKNGVLPATEVIKARAVQLLGKSTLAANIDPLAIVNAAITSDYSKCVQAGFAFIRWISKHASQEIIAAISNHLVDAMMDWITKTGWPQLPVADSTKLGPVRSLAYEAIGSIISRNPAMITDLKKFRFLLEALEKDTASMKPSIQESLSEILPAVEYLPDNVRIELRELLFRYLLDPHSDDSCKYVAVKFAVRAYPFSDATARVICLLAMARTNRSDVLEEAKRGLHPHWFKTVNTQAINHSDDSKFKVAFPRFGDLIQLVDATSSRLGGAVPTPHIRGFSLSVFNAIVSFLQQVLVMEAVENKMTALVVDEDWATKIETAIDLDNSVRDILVHHIASTDSISIIEFLKLAFDALRAKNFEVEAASASWLRILSLSPPSIVESQIEFLKDITELLSASREKTRNIASTALGIIATHDAVNANDIGQHGVNAGTVSEDTQLFEPGVLNTGDGSVSTYKDILNLASELGDPGLIYKFMALAGHSALWSSRKGAAFGLGSILSKANLDEMMENNQRLSKSLIPKLYRYKFDSNPSVQQAMQGIWDSLVKDKSAAVNDNFDDILAELLKGMGDKEWRVRQASTAALSDLLQGRPIDVYQDKLERIWMMSFRAVDDIKESVRNAGLQLTRGLASTLIRHVDTSTGTSPARATALLEHLVPFLMGNFGLQSEAQEVQSFALETIINLCKKGGAALKPFIPGLVEELLVLMSTLEPQAMNYLALNADKYGLTHNAIDASRLASVRGSPIMEAVEQMVDQATDDKTMGLLVPRLAAAIKKSVGLPSKVGASRVLVALTIRHLQGAAPYADTLLTSAAGQLGDRNDTISQSYATAAGYLCRIASDKAVLKYTTRLKTLYFDTDEASRPRLIAGFAVNALSKHAPDTFSRLASAVLPFVYVAKHDTDTAVRKVFDTVWSDNTGGSGAVRLYLPEIMALAGEQLAEQRQWGIRQVAAQSVADASNLIGDERLPREEFARLLNILFDACVGRSWSGKELVLTALIRLVERAPEALLADGSLLTRANKVVLTEARRKNKAYQVKALASLAEYLVIFPQVELYEAMFDIAEPYLEPPSESDSDASSDDDDNTNRNNGRRGEDVEMRGTEGYNHAKYKQRLKTRNAVLEAVAAAFVDPAKQRMAAAGAQPLSLENAVTVLVQIASAITSAITQLDSLASWETKLLVCSIYAKLVTKLISFVTGTPNEESVAVQLWTTVKPIWDTVIYKHFTDARDASSHEKVRVEAARCGGASLDLLAATAAAASLPNSGNAATVAAELARVRAQLEQLRTTEASDVVKAELATVLDKPRP